MIYEALMRHLTDKLPRGTCGILIGNSDRSLRAQETVLSAIALFNPPARYSATVGAMLSTWDFREVV